MASFRLADQDDDDTLEPNTPDVKRPCTDEDQYNKVLNRPYIAPSVSDHSILDHSSGAAEDDEAKTSHYDYNFDEKDYKNRRKTSTKYHEPLRRISTHRNEFQHHDKKSVKRHKKLKKENEREARLKQLVNHEEVKAESRKQSGHRRHGVTSAPVTKELDQTDGGEAPEEDNTEDVVNNDTVPSLASREDDTIDETESLPSPRNRYNDSKNKPETFELQEIKVEVPIKENVTSAKQVPSLSSREDKIEPLEPLPSLAAQKDGIQPVQQQLNDDIKIDEVKNHISTKDDSGRQNKPEVLQSKTVPERGTHPEKDSPTEKTTATEKSKVSSIEAIPGKAVAAQKAVTNKVKETAEDEDDEDVGIQMKQIRKDGELPSGKQMRKFVPKDRDSFIDIMPKIHEHDTESTDEPHSIVVSRQHGVNDRSGKAIAEQLDIESHHRDKDRIQPDLLRQGHKRHHHHRKHHHRKHEIKQHRTISEREALAERSRLRSGLLTLQETEANYAELRKRTDSIEGEEEDTLQKKDLEEIAWHRFEDLRGLRRRRPHLRKTRLKSGTLTRQSSSDTLTASVLDFPVKYDHTPHEPFIELQELTHREEGMVWRETARWIKFEEDVEASNRWGRPHVASLTFQSLLELRKGLEKGTVLLDLEQFDIHSIVETIAENMVITDQLPREEKDAVIDALLLKHRHQYQEATNIPRRSSFYNMMPFSQSTAKDDENKFPEQPEALKNEDGVICLKIDEDTASDFSVDDGMKSQMPLCVSDTEGSPATKREVTFAPPKPAEKGARKNESNVKSRIPADAEATAVMVGALKSLQNPVLAFVRLAKGVQLEGLTEVDIPCRFIFVMLGPAEKEDTYYEIGRSISTLMSDQVFHDLAYYSESREDILQAINEFLDDTIVLPPGEWDRQLLIPLLMGQSKVMAKRRKEAKQINAIAVAAAEEQDGPLKRTGRYCGGLIRDIKRRAEYYVSDFKDGLNLHSLWVILFLYFAVFAPNIAFGGLLADKTENWMGISEVIFATCLCGILFGLFAGQPLIIIGATGPVLVFEQSIYQFCKSFNIEFLPWRFWIGMWVMIILFIVVLFEGCFLVRYFTRFTEEVFGCLISAIFIYEALSYLVEVFKANPLSRKFSNGTRKVKVDSSIFSATNEPNTALMSVILLFGTFCVAFYMQKVRHSHFFGKQMRRLISDLGIIIAMASMSFLDLTVGNSVVVDKVSFGNPFTVGFRPTKYRERGWIINPIGLVETIHPGLPFAAIVPALFIGILLFMETELTGVLLNKKENNLQKLPGFNIDLVLMGILSFICGLFGLPWMCAATVRSLSHFTALSVWSTSHAPGERPFLIEVKEQRVTNIAIHVLTGISIMLAPLLHQIPVSVVFGVLLYLGVASLSHIQLVNRIIMLFMPPKHHPDVRYVRKVHTSRIYWFTAVQIVCLLILMAVKLTSVAPAFPFFIICLIPLRKLLSRFFTKEELEELDNEEGDESEDDDLDMLMHR